MIALGRPQRATRLKTSGRMVEWQWLSSRLQVRLRLLAWLMSWCLVVCVVVVCCRACLTVGWCVGRCCVVVVFASYKLDKSGIVYTN